MEWLAIVKYVILWDLLVFSSKMRVKIGIFWCFFVKNERLFASFCKK